MRGGDFELSICGGDSRLQRIGFGERSLSRICIWCASYRVPETAPAGTRDSS